MRLRRVASSFLLVGLSALPARAGQPDDRFGFHVGGGATFPLSELSDRFETGWNFGVGFTWNASARFGLRFDYLYNQFDVKAAALEVGRLDASHELQHGSINAVFDTNPGGKASLYLLAGPGIYYRKVEITRFEGYVPGVYCDPWLYICYSGAVPVESIIGSRDSTDFGVGIGAGVSVRLNESVRLFVETRYNYVWGTEYRGPRGTTQSNGQYLPLTIGLQF